MEINVRNGIAGGIGAGHELQNAAAADANQPAPGASGISRHASNLTIGMRDADPVSGGEPVAEIPNDAISRDDALGKLVSSAFSLPPPPMPAFN